MVDRLKRVLVANRGEIAARKSRALVASAARQPADPAAGCAVGLGHTWRMGSLMKHIAWVVLALAQVASADTLLVLNKADATLAFVDPTSLQVLAKVPTGEGPHEVEVSADGRVAVVANYGTGPKPGNTLSIVDVKTRKETKRLALPGLYRPHGMYAAGARIYFTAEGSRAVARYELASASIDWIGGTGQNVTHMVVVTQGEKKVYTANIGSDSVSVFDLSEAPVRIPLSHIPVGKGPEGIDLSPDGRELWVAHRAEPSLSVIDTATDKVLRVVTTGTKMANRVKFTRDGKRVLVSDPMSNEVVILDAATKEVVQRVPTKESPAGILIAPDGKRAFIACITAGVVQVLDLETLSITGSVATGNQPDGMAWAKSG
ncbi:MAG: cytochrome D1 domain-containing protein [Thermoanaerobaculia bacterium]